MTEQCKVCETVQAWGDGTHRCMICRKIFIDPDVCSNCPKSQAEEQRPVEEDDDA